ncbi:MAG: MinD/ParA family protein [Lachnospiraceae bacterium]|jgi:flagellar biosynthesis protein FlhG|nr:MinD/ParA family protein [Lachnospiraceae bacterium]MEE3460436.1 MinD/ParA family protein [Lachnospiraceae bacterium]
MMDQAENLRSMVQGQKSPVSSARVLTVTSGKGGVGKSSLSVNMAIALARLGKRVLILDADFGLANIEVMLGIRPKHNLADMMFRGMSLSDIISEGPEGVGFISCGSGLREMINLSDEQVTNVFAHLSELDSLADVIIIDTGAGISKSVTDLVSASPDVLLVTTPEPTSITDAYALLKTLNRAPSFDKEKTRVNIITNKVKDQEAGRDLYDRFRVIVGNFLNIDLKYLGYLPDDKTIERTVISQKPVTISYPDSSSSRLISDMAARWLSGSELSENERKSVRDIFIRMFRQKNK